MEVDVKRGGAAMMRHVSGGVIPDRIAYMAASLGIVFDSAGHATSYHATTSVAAVAWLESELAREWAAR